MRTFRMPRSKKQKVEEEVSDEEDRDSSGDEDSSLSTEVVQADFEAFAPTEKDFGGIKALLQQLLLKAPVNLSELAQLIIQQSDLGCVHKVANDESESGEDAMETDEDVYGLVTVVDVTSDNQECVQQFKALLRKRYAESTSKSPFPEKAKTVFDHIWQADKSKPIGWVINERLINIPFQIAVPSFESLLEELDANEIKFDKFIAILKIHKLNSSSGAGTSSTASGGKSGKKKKKQKSAQAPDMVIFANSEEELLAEDCDCAFDYAVSNETEGGILGERRTEDGSYRPFRRVVVFDRAIFDKFLTKLKSVGNV